MGQGRVAAAVCRLVGHKPVRRAGGGSTCSRCGATLSVPMRDRIEVK